MKDNPLQRCISFNSGVSQVLIPMTYRSKASTLVTNLHKYTNSKAVKTMSSFHLQLLLAGANQSVASQLDRRLMRIQDVKKKIDFEVDENSFKLKLSVHCVFFCFCNELPLLMFRRLKSQLKKTSGNGNGALYRKYKPVSLLLYSSLQFPISFLKDPCEILC
jgi:hypothetical protein